MKTFIKKNIEDHGQYQIKKHTIETEICLPCLEIILLEPFDKVPDGVLLIVGPDQSLYFLFFLYQNIISMLSQELWMAF